jgi:hypothetical protein
VSPGYPQNPRLIVIDTSVLLQLIATDQLSVLRQLRSNYGVQAAIADAVKSETAQILASTPKFMGRQEQLRKAIHNGTIALIDRSLLASLFGSGADGLLRQIESEGQRLRLRVDRGEAYSHASAAVLGVLIATNDTSAINRLLRDNETIPRPILRFWDLIVFAFQSGHLDDSACDKIRQTLRRVAERVPDCFGSQSFADGLPSFYPRLADGGTPPVGATTPQDRFDERLILRR